VSFGENVKDDELGRSTNNVFGTRRPVISITENQRFADSLVPGILERNDARTFYPRRLSASFGVALLR
jgi:hypothetical protein